MTGIVMAGFVLYAITRLFRPTLAGIRIALNAYMKTLRTKGRRRTPMANEFEIKGIDVPVFDLKMHGVMNKEVLKLHTEFMGRLTEEMVNFKSEAIRKALMSMGWTTPETGKELMAVNEKWRGDDCCQSAYDCAVELTEIMATAE